MPKLTVLCASHIECCQRLMYLHYMLNSWFNQTIKCEIFVSISYSENMSRDIIKLMNSWKNKTNLFNFVLRGFKCSQFEHYFLLLNEKKLDWVLFTDDDDDLWNTDRVEKYIKCDLKKQQIYCISHTITSDNIYANDIQDIIQDKNTHKSEPCEYFNYCLPAKLCLKIINTVMTNGQLLKIPTFDLHFTSHLNTYPIINIESQDFLYYHRMYFNFDKWCN